MHVPVARVFCALSSIDWHDAGVNPGLCHRAVYSDPQAHDTWAIDGGMDCQCMARAPTLDSNLCKLDGQDQMEVLHNAGVAYNQDEYKRIVRLVVVEVLGSPLLV